jgi:D-tagatose-1,6-bisphosphate aldolase subunit GatZ/KbaZ
MYLDDVVAAQKRGEARGIASICSAHPRVIKQALATFEHPLIEATCNQVNQFGGYTGMTPRSFAESVRRAAEQCHVPSGNVLLGGDHLGPHVWRSEPAASAMAKAGAMVAEYVGAGFTKIHLDCSMGLGDDPGGPLDKEVAAARAAELARVAEQSGDASLRYVIGTEVPRPGGTTLEEERLHVTSVDDARETLEIHHKAFHERGLHSAWERVMALVVQPGVEFGDDAIVRYSPEAACELSGYIEDQSIVYEAHSTDYQSPEALQHLVRDHFAILKVGPALTFAYREAVFALAMLEDEWLPPDECSHLVQILDNTMTAQPVHWNGYYSGSDREQAYKRKFSLSDRLRYYWTQPEVQQALQTLMHNVGDKVLPYSLSSQFLGDTGITAEQAIERRIGKVLKLYSAACKQTE